jgi:preprotein translocase subunit SecF
MGDEQKRKDTIEEKPLESTTSESVDQNKLVEESHEVKEEVKEEPKIEEKQEEKPVEEPKEEEKSEEKVEEIKEEPKEEVKDEPKEKKKLKLFGFKKKHKEETEAKEKKPILKSIRNLYVYKYKKLLIIPFSLLIIALILIGLQIAVTGDFVRKDVSLKGGITITIPSEDKIDINSLENYLTGEFPDSDLSVRSLKSAGQQIGVIIDGDEEVNSEDVITALEPKLGKLGQGDYSVTEMGSSLGASFFRETLKAIFVSFLLMGIVVFWYFGTDLKSKIFSTILTITVYILMFFGGQSLTKDIIAYVMGVVLIGLYLKSSIPSFMVILNVFSDVIVTLAVINIMGIKLSTAGIAAFLMIIGYSVDTNILLSTKLLKKKEGSVIERLFNAMQTGLTMTLTTAAAIIVALIFTQSEVIKQIMTILLIGLIVDMIYTWLQNAGILRLYLDKNHSESKNTFLKDFTKKIFIKLKELFTKKKNGPQD